MAQDMIAGRPLVRGEEPLTQDNPNFGVWLPVHSIDPRDERCKDSWIPRHRDLIRLTGKHPFNAEPELQAVMRSGLLTPTSIHFVRNHGAVPRLDWASHRIHITGMVDREIQLSMDNLLELMPAHTVSCLLTCCGNRRKEVNDVKNSQGFSWGPSAVSVNEWTGVRLADVLKFAGVNPEATHVHFTGPKGELPKGDDGTYGTAMTLSHAMDVGSDVLLAFMQNGQYLHPDHGFPVRMLIPGWIGGRMVKWLTHIHVSDRDSENWYHFHDNKTLPPHVDADLAKREGWWRDPAYILYELNINSVISSPAHDERVFLDRQEKYTMKGYAYSGGGRQITRVEVSFDGGETFMPPAKLIRTEKPNIAGKYWCWVHWELEVTTLDFVMAKEVVCRAWDYSQNTQPAVLTWTLLGQGNNCMFRLKLHREVDEQGRICIRFQQPAPLHAGPLGNLGWRGEEAKAKADAAAALPAVPAAPAAAAAAPAAAAPAAASVVPALPDAPVLDPTKRYITKEMLDKHSDESSAWLAWQGKVYDATPYLDDHPGGADSILMEAGTDATEAFNSVHGEAAKAQLQEYYIGELLPEGATVDPALLYVAPGEQAAPQPPAATANTGAAVNSNASVATATPPAVAAAAISVPVPAVAAAAVSAAAQAAPVAAPVAAPNGVNEVVQHPESKVGFLSRQAKPVKLVQKQSLSHDVIRLRFSLGSEHQLLGLPTGKHMFIMKKVLNSEGQMEEVRRAYTPITANETLGYFDLVVKVYRAGVHPRFPDGGRFSQILDNLQIEDEVEVKGPIGHFVYPEPGSYLLKGKKHAVRKMNMIAGGTGITPMYQVMKAILADPTDSVELRLLYANQTDDDILVRRDMEDLEAKFPDRLKIHYTLDRPPSGWRYSKGFVTLEMCQAHLFEYEEGAITVLCGPPPMLKFACYPNLEKMGFEKDVTAIGF